MLGVFLYLKTSCFHIYSNFVKGVEPELKKPHQFNEYIKYVSNLDKDASINYWNQYLVEPEESRLERLENKSWNRAALLFYKESYNKRNL